MGTNMVFKYFSTIYLYVHQNPVSEITYIVFRAAIIEKVKRSPRQCVL